MTEDATLSGWIIWGASGHAKVIRECLASNQLPLVATFDNAPQIQPPFRDVRLFEGRDGFAQWKASSRGRHGFIVAIGGKRGPERCELHAWLVAEGLVPLAAIHRTAFVADSARIGAGSHVLANGAVCVEASLGDQCIVNTGATVDHECTLGNGVHIAPGAHLGGLVTIGDHAFVGIGASILPRIKIGPRAIVGAGAVVREDVPADTTVVGVPARVVKRAKT